jgi:hypothetical protein
MPSSELITHYSIFSQALLRSFLAVCNTLMFNKRNTHWEHILSHIDSVPVMAMITIKIMMTEDKKNNADSKTIIYIDLNKNKT